MSDKVGPRRPPVATRFRKGQSGNPKGRPRGARARRSAFNIIFDRNITVVQGGEPHEFSLEEALHLKTFEAAMAGKRSAIREVWKMIEIREKWFARNAPNQPPIQRRIEPIDPRNADEAMILLGIARRDADADAYERLLLKPWVVHVAARRRGRRPLTQVEMYEVTRCMDEDTLPISED